MLSSWKFYYFRNYELIFFPKIQDLVCLASLASKSTSLRWWQTRTQCCGHIVADTNVSPFARAGNICCGHKICVRDTKMFLMSFRNILCPQQMFPGLHSIETIMNNNVSATMCPRLPPSLLFITYLLISLFCFSDDYKIKGLQ